MVIILSFVIAMGNLLVLMALMTSPKLKRDISSMFIASLACADLIVGVIVVPTSVPLMFPGSEGLSRWPSKILYSIDWLCVTTSIQSLCAIAVDRYMAVMTPLRYLTLMTRRRARVAIVIIWIVSATICFLPIQMDWWIIDGPRVAACYENPEMCHFVTKPSYIIGMSVTSFYVPLALMVFVYVRVLLVALHQAETIKKSSTTMDATTNSLKIRTKADHRALKTLGFVMGVFVICWLPFFMVNIIKALCHNCVSELVFISLNWLGHSHSAINPILYSRSSDFRTSYRSLLTYRWCFGS
uniref:G-protein coupled receptors family 1 profile domain-containing protein n=1 Tax=Eptatretus burgeri TaxID=7764 RepID=A0A8C4NCS3_EPTBU